MKSMAPLAAVALALSLACSGTPLDTAQSSADAARGKPDGPQACENTGGNAFSNQLAALCVATANSTFLSRNNAVKDRNGLIGKLNRAETKCLTDGDAAGAIGKLTEYAVKVESLILEGKIDAADGAGLAAGVDPLITALVNEDLLCPSGMPPNG